MEEEGGAKLFHPQQLAVLKVALAVAIIKNKPQDISAREYTEKLALQFTTLQKDWKEKASDLEMQLLQARQQLVRCSLGGSLGNVAHGEDADATEVCDGHSSEQAMEEDGRHWSHIQRQHLLQNLHFLQNVSRLHVARSSEPSFCPSQQGTFPLVSSHHVVMETVTKTLTSLSSMCKDGGMVESVSLKELKDVVELALDLLQDAAPEKEKLEELFATCQQFAKVMMDQISHRTLGNNMTEWRETCRSLLPPFSSSPVLSEFIALELVEQVQKGISNMQSFEEDVTTFDHSLVSSAGEALSLLNYLFSSPKWPRTEKVNQELHSLKHRSYRVVPSYPLFAYHVWNVASFLQ